MTKTMPVAALLWNTSSGGTFSTKGVLACVKPPPPRTSSLRDPSLVILMQRTPRVSSQAGGPTASAELPFGAADGGSRQSGTLP